MKGILFGEAMYKAIIDGRKTQTRRICPVQPKSDEWKIHRLLDGTGKSRRHIGQLLYVNGLESDKRFFNYKYKHDEIIYVKEPYKLYSSVIYKYDNFVEHKRLKFRNKLFMPEKYARLFLKIKICGVERVQSITDEDCIKEGAITYVEATKQKLQKFSSEEIVLDLPQTPRDAYAILFDCVNGTGAWERNPYVFVYEFEIFSRKG
jgi:hypothetical protein